MPIVTDTCISIDCDTPGCTAQAGEEDGGTHFPDLDGAAYYLDGWLIAPDGTATCSDCVHAAQCRVGQHEWSSAPVRGGAPGERCRWCVHCFTETHPLPDDEPGR